MKRTKLNHENSPWVGWNPPGGGREELPARSRKARPLNLPRIVCAIGLAGLLAGPMTRAAGVPPILSYQGQISVQGQGANFTGNGAFKFAIVTLAGQSLWSHDGTSVNGSAPASSVTLPVDKGYFSVLLGDVTLPNMDPLGPSVFQLTSEVWLRVWFDDGIHGLQQLSPDQRLVSVAYAMVAENANLANGSVNTAQLADGAVQGTKIANGAIGTAHLQNGSVTTDKLANGAVTSAKLANGAVGSDALADHLLLGGPGTKGSLTVYGTDGVSLRNTAGTAEMAKLHTELPGFSNTGGYLEMFEPGGQRRCLLAGIGGKGFAHFLQANNNLGLILDGQYGTGGGSVAINQADGQLGLLLRGDSGGAGYLDVRNSAGTPRFKVYGEGAGDSGEMALTDKFGFDAIKFKAHNGNIIFGGPEITIGTSGLDPSLKLSGGLGGSLTLYDIDGNSSVSLTGLDGYVRARVVEITGGSDLSEAFDIGTAGSEPEPGMIVCIDPAQTGRLVLSSQAYDRTVAGVISGAGGVKPGMIMGQAGSIANGKHPVALTGRVYCQVDAAYGAIEPGDLITTSDTPGHGMRVSDPARAQGAIVGKAMTGWESGRGMVLVLVSLN